MYCCASAMSFQFGLSLQPQSYNSVASRFNRPVGNEEKGRVPCEYYTRKNKEQRTRATSVGGILK